MPESERYKRNAVKSKTISFSLFEQIIHFIYIQIFGYDFDFPLNCSTDCVECDHDLSEPIARPITVEWLTFLNTIQSLNRVHLKQFQTYQ